jgi:hypothetical protein
MVANLYSSRLTAMVASACTIASVTGTLTKAYATVARLSRTLRE